MLALNKKYYKLSDMYKDYIANANADYESKLREIELYEKLLAKIKFSIEERRDLVEAEFGICVYNYWEWNSDIPDDKNRLFLAVTEAYNSFNNYKHHAYRSLYLSFIKFFKIIYRISVDRKQLNKIKARKSINRKTFMNYCNTYYTTVANKVLEGKIYKYSHGIGELLIEKLRFENTTHSIMDYKGTRENKKAILAQGLKLYDHGEYVKSIFAGKKYDGVKYIKTISNDDIVRIVLVHKKFRNASIMKFKYKTSNKKFKYEDYTSVCTTIQEIQAIDTDLRAKLSMLLEINPSYQINYIRNVEQLPVSRRINYSKFRQRL